MYKYRCIIQDYYMVPVVVTFFMQIVICSFIDFAMLTFPTVLGNIQRSYWKLAQGPHPLARVTYIYPVPPLFFYFNIWRIKFCKIMDMCCLFISLFTIPCLTFALLLSFLKSTRMPDCVCLSVWSKGSWYPLKRYSSSLQ